MYNDGPMSEIAVELDLAEKNRREGFESRARVLARRAAAKAILEYFKRRNLPAANLNALDLIQAFKDLPDISPDMRRSSEMLLLRVNEAFQLPSDVDLIAVARRLVQELGRD